MKFWEEQSTYEEMAGNNIHERGTAMDMHAMVLLKPSPQESGILWLFIYNDT